MKRILIAFVVIGFFALNQSVKAQTILEKQISLNNTEYIVKELLDEVQNKGNFTFSYGNDVDLNSKVKFTTKDLTIKEILEETFKNTNIVFKEVGNKILLYPKTSKSATKTTFSGYILDKSTGEALIGATLWIPKLNTGTIANTFGFYSITVDYVEDMEIIYSFIGYNETKIVINSSENQTININLEFAENQIDEVVVNAENSNLSHLNSQMSSINIKTSDIESLPSFMGEKDVLKITQLMPGVKSSSDGSSGFYVRGGGPDQNLILLDGATVYNTTHIFNVFSIFNSDAISNIELIKGGFPARYGGKLSSVLDVTMKEGNMYDYSGKISIGYLTSKMTIEGPILKGKSSFIVSGRITPLFLVMKPIIKQIANSTGESASQGLYFNDFNAKVNYKISDKDRIFLSYYFGNDKLDAEITETSEVGENKTVENIGVLLGWGNQTATARWNHLFTNKLFSKMMLVYSQFNFNFGIDDEIQFTSPYYSYNSLTQYNFLSGIKDYTFNYNLEYFPNSKNNVKAGISSIYHVFTPGVNKQVTIDNNSDLDTIYGDNKYISKEYLAYIEDDITITEKFQTNVGVHFSGFQTDTKFFPSVQPRISARYKFSDNFTFKTSFSTMKQYIHLLSNSTMGLPLDLWVPSTAEIPPMFAWQVASGLYFNFPDKKVKLTIEGYYKKMSDLITYKAGANFTDSKERWEDKIEIGGLGEAYGAEIFIQKTSGKLTGWIGYTLSWTTRQFENINNGEVYFDRFDRRHDLSIVLAYNPNKRIDFSACWVYSSGNAITFPVGYYNYGGNYIPNIYSSFTQQNPVYIYQEKNSLKMPDYHRLDLGINLKKEKKRGLRTWNFSVYNVYARKNPFFIFPSTDDNGNGKLQQACMFTIIPSISYSFEF